MTPQLAGSRVEISVKEGRVYWTKVTCTKVHAVLENSPVAFSERIWTMLWILGREQEQGMEKGIKSRKAEQFQVRSKYRGVNLTWNGCLLPTLLTQILLDLGKIGPR